MATGEIAHHFSFCHNDFKSHLLQMCEDAPVGGMGGDPARTEAIKAPMQTGGVIKESIP